MKRKVKLERNKTNNKNGCQNKDKRILDKKKDKCKQKEKGKTRKTRK